MEAVETASQIQSSKFAVLVSAAVHLLIANVAQNAVAAFAGCGTFATGLAKIVSVVSH